MYKANIVATKIINDLRKNGIFAEKDICERSLKAQFKYADKKKARFVITIGDNEVLQNIAKIKNMTTGEERDIKLEVQDIINVVNSKN